MPIALTIGSTTCPGSNPTAPFEFEPHAKGDTAFEDVFAEGDVSIGPAPDEGRGEILPANSVVEDSEELTEVDDLPSEDANSLDAVGTRFSGEVLASVSKSGQGSLEGQQDIVEQHSGSEFNASPEIPIEFSHTLTGLPKVGETSMKPGHPPLTLPSMSHAMAVSDKSVPKIVNNSAELSPENASAALVTPDKSDEGDHPGAPAETTSDAQWSVGSRSVQTSDIRMAQGPLSLNSAHFKIASSVAEIEASELEEKMSFPMRLSDLSTIHIRQDNTLLPAVPASSTRAETAHAVAGQLAAAITAKPGSGAVEISLNPEELGKVSITLASREDGIHFMITADRPETLELMRRHISILASEFQDIGFGDLSFHLGMSMGAQQEEGSKSTEPYASTKEEEKDAETPGVERLADSNRALDLRL